MSLKENYLHLKSELPETAKLVAVSKTKPVELIKELYDLGHRDFGENKVQELKEKAEVLSELKDIRWHFIGQLQSNKLNQLLSVPHLFSIHSIDRKDLFVKLLKKDFKGELKIFLQINTSGEVEKSGFTNLDELEETINLFSTQSQYKLQGLMTIGKIRTNAFEADARESFSKLAEIKTHLETRFATPLELSMGMSSDFPIALEYGANWVRVGSNLFGQRM